MVADREAVNIARVLAEFIDGFQNVRVTGTVNTLAANAKVSVPYATEERDAKVKRGSVPGGLSHFHFFDDARAVYFLEEALAEAGLKDEYISALKERVEGGDFAFRHARPPRAALAAHDVLKDRNYASYFEPQAPPERNAA